GNAGKGTGQRPASLLVLPGVCEQGSGQHTGDASQGRGAKEQKEDGPAERRKVDGKRRKDQGREGQGGTRQAQPGGSAAGGSPAILSDPGRKPTRRDGCALQGDAQGSAGLPMLQGL